LRDEADQSEQCGLQDSERLPKMLGPVTMFVTEKEPEAGGA
jgi:hypothetical protein